MSVFGPYKAIVDHVTDGDTINARLDLGFDLTVYTRIRVLGINAPELRTPEGKAAKTFAETILPPNTPILVTSLGWDKYGGRIDGTIAIGEYDFAQIMVEEGHAVRKDYT